jgi:hypothetical protein
MADSAGFHVRRKHFNHRNIQYIMPVKMSVFPEFDWIFLCIVQQVGVLTGQSAGFFHGFSEILNDRQR